VRHKNDDESMGDLTLKRNTTGGRDKNAYSGVKHYQRNKTEVSDFGKNHHDYGEGEFDPYTGERIYKPLPIKKNKNLLFQKNDDGQNGI
jgi:hypothetical protein